MKLSRLLGKILLPAFLQRVLGIPRSSLYGEARWMSRRRQRRYYARRYRGVLLPPHHRLSPQESFNHVALVAPSGSGKTTRFVIPNLLELEGSAVVTDPSGEIYRQTSGHLAARGFRLQVLAPKALETSLRFNPLAYFRTGSELRQLATTLTGTAKGDDGGFWRTGAINALYLGMQAVAALPLEADRTLGNVRRLLNSLSADDAAADAFMGRQLPDEAFGEYRAFMGQEEKIRSGHLSTARTALDLWSDADVRRLTNSNTVDIAGLREQPTVIYLIVPEKKIRYFSVILNLFYSACFEHCMAEDEADEEGAAGGGQQTGGGRRLPIYFFLDEFGNLGKIEDFGTAVTTLRKRECSLNIILQALSQLDTLYGKDEARTIFGNCAHKLFMRGLDPGTCGYVETMLGQQTECERDRDGSGGRERQAAAPLLRHDEVRMLPAERTIVVSGGERPALIRTRTCFRWRPWKAAIARRPAARPAGTAETETAIGANGRPRFLETGAGG